MILPEQLSGYGITLHRWQPGDAERRHRAVMESVDHLRPWMDWIGQEPLTVEQRRTLLHGWERQWQAGGDAIYGVIVEPGQVAGGCGLHRRAGADTLEIGYWTHPSFLRRGLASAAARLLTDAAFSVPGIQWVEIHHDKANLASRGIPKRLGYEFVGEAPADERAVPGEVRIDWIWRTERSAWCSDTAPSASGDLGS